MSAVLTPKRWSNKPRPGTQIQWGHSISRGLVGCWNMSENSGTTIFDSALFGPGQFTSTPPIWKLQPGGQSILTSSAGSWISIANNPGIPIFKSNNPTQFSLQCKFMLVNLRNYNGLFTKTASNQPKPFDIYVDNGGTLRFFVGDGTGTLGSVNTSALSAGVVYDMVCTMNTGAAAGQQTIYLNGVINGGPGGGSSLASGSDPILIGNRNDNVTNGDVYFFYCRIWSRALSWSEVMQLYTDPYCFMQPQSPQRRYWFAPASTPLTHINAQSFYRGMSSRQEN